MPAAVQWRVFVERHAADNVDAEPHYLPHQRFGAGRLDNSFLRKGDDLDIHQIAEALAGADQALGRPGAADRIDVDMGPQPRDAIRERLCEHAGGAIGDLAYCIVALDLPKDLDGFGQCPRNIDRRALGDQRLVEVNMRLDKAYNGHPALGVECEVRICVSGALADADKSPLRYSDVAYSFDAPQRNVLDENINIHRRGLRTGMPQCSPSSNFRRYAVSFSGPSNRFTRFDACCTVTVPGCINRVREDGYVCCAQYATEPPAARCIRHDAAIARDAAGTG